MSHSDRKQGETSRPPSPQQLHQGKIIEDISYYNRLGSRNTHDHEQTLLDKESGRHTLDIYLPVRNEVETKTDKKKKLSPVVIHVHGGGWQRGNKSNEWRGGPTFGRRLSKEGYTTIVLSYRLSDVNRFVLTFWSLIPTLIMFGLWELVMYFVPTIDVVPWYGILLTFWLIFFGILLHFTNKNSKGKLQGGHPHQVSDVAMAIAWVKENLQNYVPDADMNSVFVSGHSAGGHLASLVALDKQYLQQAGVPDNFLKGVVVMSGIFSLDKPMAEGWCHPKNIFFRSAYGLSAVGASYSAEPDLWASASPINHITARAPPFLVLNAEFDFWLDHDARRFVSVLREAQVTVDHFIVKKTSHSSITKSGQAFQHLLEYLEHATISRELVNPTTDK